MNANLLTRLAGYGLELAGYVFCKLFPLPPAPKPIKWGFDELEDDEPEPAPEPRTAVDELQDGLDFWFKPPAAAAGYPDEYTNPADFNLGTRPRIVEAPCGLGDLERDAEWIDKDGDRWRYNRQDGMWEYKIGRPDISTGWLPMPTEYGITSHLYAPYTEVYTPDDGPVLIPGRDVFLGDRFPPSESSCAAGEARVGDCGPSAQERPAPVNGSPGAGLPSLSCNDLMDAARAVRHYAAHIHPRLQPHWDTLNDRLELAAITANQ